MKGDEGMLFSISLTLYCMALMQAPWVRPRLVCGMSIPLRKGITIHGNRWRWNGITIPIFLFGCNGGIEHCICILLFGTVQYIDEWNYIIIKFSKIPL